jgi:hypothetical protein
MSERSFFLTLFAERIVAVLLLGISTSYAASSGVLPSWCKNTSCKGFVSV